ncbi:MAG TPA: glycoside hydrolase domain-containing protein [Myxococcales bacterium]|nr:glycoside hydrolase domain-containing protein [Myxococcales bacterium]
MLLLLALLQIWVADESEKVRPDATPPAAAARAPRIRLAAAGGECAGAQLVVRGPAIGLTAASKGKLKLDVYRVATVAVTLPSGPDGGSGEWPDPLIPSRDTIYGEARNAFPVDVRAGRAQAVFVEACLPRGAGPSRLAGSVRLSWQGGGMDVPVEVRARAFDLPLTPPLVTAFGFSGYSAARGHGRSAEAARELTRAYDLMALRRGITLIGGTQDPPSFQKDDDGVRIDWTSYDAEVGPFLDGAALPGGARWTSVELREPGKLSRAQRRSWRRQWQEHFRQRGWLDRLFRYVEDEPSPDAFPGVEEKARELREDAPDVRRLVTAPWTAALPDVDLWTPVLNCVGEKNEICPRAVPRAKYDKLWWYQSCMSHGCSSDGKPVLDPAFRGWPSYMIDAPATAARAMGALAFANDIAGELYFDVVYAYDHGDPWTSQWAFGGNGDGTLYYPGTPARIGGRHDVPVESLRVVQIARSLADHAYLSLCAQLGDPSLARAEARAVAPSLRGFSRDPKAYAQMREHLAARIEALQSARKLGAR